MFPVIDVVVFAWYNKGWKLKGLFNSLFPLLWKGKE